jgi:hypothetical protein
MMTPCYSQNPTPNSKNRICNRATEPVYRVDIDDPFQYPQAGRDPSVTRGWTASTDVFPCGRATHSPFANLKSLLESKKLS